MFVLWNSSQNKRIKIQLTIPIRSTTEITRRPCRGIYKEIHPFLNHTAQGVKNYRCGRFTKFCTRFLWFFPLETFGNNANLEIKHFPFGAYILYINLKAKRPHYKAKLYSDLYEGLKYLLRQGICWYLVFLWHPGASGLVGSNLTVSGCNEYRWCSEEERRYKTHTLEIKGAASCGLKCLDGCVCGRASHSWLQSKKWIQMRVSVGGFACECV